MLPFLALAFFIFKTPAFAQLNVEFVANFTYEYETSDVWGYTAADGTEYVLVGVYDGVSIVSLADPADPEEVVFLEGEHSGWRDLRTFGDYAYVVADESDTEEGLWVIDLRGLPNSVGFNKILFTFNNDEDTLYTCHNVWVDDKGFAHLSGCNLNDGGAIFLDLNSDPFNPVFAGFGEPVYTHDNYARGDTLYTSEIYEGDFGIYDVSDKSNPILLATQGTPFRFTHNVWLSDDSKTLFTTDEKPNAPTAAYDVSDPNDIRLLDEFRPNATLGTNVIPHNVHVLNDFLVISHYTDGCIIVDANQPDNLIEVGNFDTNTDFSQGFHGAWGAYPFFPSGLIAVTDIENGLFILRPTYVRASYLEGNVIDANSTMPIPNAEVRILAPTPYSELTDLSGDYKTGLAEPGTYDVLFKARGYFDQTLSATISSGETTVLDVQMVPLPGFPVAGQVMDETTGEMLEGATVFFENEDFEYTAITDADGLFGLPFVLQGDYTFYVGKWGYANLFVDNMAISQNEYFVFETSPGYEDNFNTDLGWAVSGDALSGLWERGVPNGTNYETTIYNPFNDSPADPGERCYVTGNADVSSIFADNVDDGQTVLASQPMALKSMYDEPFLTYDAWFYTIGSNNLPNDTLKIMLTNGNETIELQRYDDSNKVQQWTQSPAFDLNSLLDVTDNMRLFLVVGDLEGTPNIVEAGLDNFKITEGTPNNVLSLNDGFIKMQLYPNPFQSQVFIDYKIEKDFKTLKLLVFDFMGRKMDEVALSAAEGAVPFEAGYPAGVYFFSFEMDGQMSAAMKVVKL